MAVSERDVMVIEWCLWTTAVLLAGLRFGLHAQKKSLVLFASDLWLLVAVSDCTALIACDTATYRAGAMNIFMGAPENIRKIRFATMYLFDFGLYYPKFSMLAFYTRFIPSTSPKLRGALWAVIAFVSVAAVVSFFSITFWCGSDVSVNWNSNEGGCVAFSTPSLGRLTWSLNIISEALIFVLPLPLIRNLQLKYRREKIGLLSMFLLGFLTIMASVARFSVQDIVTNNLPMYILAMIEYTTPIIILSALTLRPLLRKIYRVVTDSSPGSNPFSRSTKTYGNASGQHGIVSSSSTAVTPWRKGRGKGGAVYAEGSLSGAAYGSEVELTELEMGRIYKTEEISVTSVRGDGNEAAEEQGKVDWGKPN